VGAHRGHLRLCPRESEICERPAEGRAGRAEGRHGRLRGDHLALYCHLAAPPTFRANGLGAAPLLPEFYLEDDKGKGHWFPCQSAGAREFGGINDTRPILQKGDNFRGPKGKQRYMAEHLTGKPAAPAAASRK